MAESKKVTIARVLDILRENTDVDHPMKQSEIVQRLKEEYDIDAERKAIGRDISRLREIGYCIEQTKDGCYLDRGETDRAGCNFEDSELRLLIDSVLSSKHINAIHAKGLIDKLMALANKYFRKTVTHVHKVNECAHTDSKQLFLNIDYIVEAKAKGKKISFNTYKYDIDKKLHKNGSVIASPYDLVFHNQHYYLICNEDNSDKLINIRVDHIGDIEILDSAIKPIRDIKGYENGLDYNKITNAPYLFGEPPVRVEMIIDPFLVDQVIEWFGKDVVFEKINDKQLRVRLSANTQAMRYWALQFMNYVEVVKPFSLREQLKSDIKAAYNKYFEKEDLALIS